jgi:hypothetical protein
MSTLKKLKHAKDMEKLQKSMKSTTMKRPVKVDYLDESLVSEITDDEESNDYDINSDGEVDFDKNEETIDYADEDVLGEEKAMKYHMMDNEMSFHNDIFLSVYFRNILEIFNIQEQDDRFDVQRTINSYLMKTKLKSTNDEIVITAIEMFNKYNVKTNDFTDYIKTLVTNKYLKFPGINTSSFIDTKVTTNDTSQIYNYYNIIFENATEFIENFTGERKQIKIKNNYDERIFNKDMLINPPMNPELIRFRDFSPELFDELRQDIMQANKFRYAPLLNNFVEIINKSSRSTTINWSTDIVPIQNKPEITNIPIIIRNLISINTNKFSGYTKDHVIIILTENPKLIKNIKNFYKFIKVYDEKRTNMRKRSVDVDMKPQQENPYGNLFIKRRRN